MDAIYKITWPTCSRLLMVQGVMSQLDGLVIQQRLARTHAAEVKIISIEEHIPRYTVNEVMTEEVLVRRTK